MKRAKTFVLATIVAGAVLAPVGVGSASAAEVYSTGVTVAAGTTVAGSLTPGSTWREWTTDTKTSLDTCAGYTFHGTIQPYSGGDVEIDIDTETWSSCSVTTHTLSNGSLFISSTGTVVGKGEVVTVNFSGVSCRYGTGSGTDLGTLTTGKLSTNAIINEQEPKSFLCPDTTEWIGLINITAPHDATVS